LQQVVSLYQLDTALVLQNNLTLADLDGIFNEMLDSVDCLYNAVDTLDEIPETKAIASALLEFCEKYPSRSRLAITRIRSSLKPCLLMRELPVARDSIAHGIEHYAQYRLNSEPTFLAIQHGNRSIPLFLEG
jgi:hypothetical protein